MIMIQAEIKPHKTILKMILAREKRNSEKVIERCQFTLSIFSSGWEQDSKHFIGYNRSLAQYLGDSIQQGG